MSQMAEEKRFETYAEFWPYYLAEHSKPLTRVLHLLGTVCGTTILIWSVLTVNWFFIPLALIVGYGFAWVSHFFIEKNRPATFKYPWWSFISDYRMAYRMITFRKM